MQREWWRDAVVYQVYPRSFADSNGDGVGDLPGLTGKLDRLAWLGVDAIWVSPFFPSPMKDFGYDVADYEGVDPLFGVPADAERLVAEAHARGIRVLLDLVVNHSSDEHPWFKAARASREAPEHALYLWKPLAGRVPNNWKSLFELRSAWYPNEATGERYLATFTGSQPEFDWRNPELRRRVYAIMRHWFRLGVDGFRLDVATAYVKDEAFRSNPLSFRAVPDFFQRHLYDRNRPEVHGIFREMRAVAEEFGDALVPGSRGPGRVLVGETHGHDRDLAASCHGAAGDELHMAFNFDFLDRPWDAAAFRRAAESWYEALPAGAWPNFTLSNHDQPRHAFRHRPGPFAPPGTGDARAKAAATILLCLRGTPFLYYGEEIGMGCRRIPRSRLVDPLGRRTWPLAFLGRDPERTPMQWDSSPHAGFSTVEPWLPLNPDWERRNVAAQEADPASILSWYRALIALRRSNEVLRSGSIRFLDQGRGILAFERRPEEPGRGGALRVVVNFRPRAATLALPAGGRVLLSSAGRASGELLPAGRLELAPTESLILGEAP